MSTFSKITIGFDEGALYAHAFRDGVAVALIRRNPNASEKHGFTALELNGSGAIGHSDSLPAIKGMISRYLARKALEPVAAEPKPVADHIDVAPVAVAPVAVAPVAVAPVADHSDVAPASPIKPDVSTFAALQFRAVNPRAETPSLLEPVAVFFVFVALALRAILQAVAPKINRVTTALGCALLSGHERAARTFFVTSQRRNVWRFH